MLCQTQSKNLSVPVPNVPTEDAAYLRKVFVQTWGCQMNVADSERMLSLLGKLNYRQTQTAAEADLILLNTCHIREKARHKLVSRLGELRDLKNENPNLVIAVVGCVAQAEGKSLAKDVPFVDLIFGPDHIDRLPDMLTDVFAPDRTRETLVYTKFDSKDKKYTIPVDDVKPLMDERHNEVSRFVNIIKGCNNFCTFCVVPYTRGREKSRAVSEILEETRLLTAGGVKEIVLLGQNVNSYGLDLLGIERIQDAGDALPFADLLYQVSAIPEVERIRFTSSNPHDFTPRLAQAFADLPKVTNSFHLAVQSGSDRMLDRMNRQYTRAEYFERVGWIRAVRPDMAFSTDVIVGFPGETDEEFEETCSLIEEMKYAFIYAFKYSQRPGTPATRFKDQVDEKVKDARLQKLLALQNKETLRQNIAEISKTRQCLVLYKDKKLEHSWYGRTYEGRLVRIVTPREIVGKTVDVEIVDANATALVGRMV